MLSQLSTPSPLPIVISMPDSGSPWWGVPIITAGAVLIGAFIAFLSVRASDARKARRDTAERIMLDTRSVGLELIEVVNRFSNLIRDTSAYAKQLDKNESFITAYDSIVPFQRVWTKFELYAQNDVLESGLELRREWVDILLLVGNKPITLIEFDRLEEKRLAFVNTLRKASGVEHIDAFGVKPLAKKKVQRR